MDGRTLEGFDNKTGFFQDAVGPLMKSPFEWQRHGQSGSWVSDLFPNMARHVDKMAFIHSCWTQSNNHSPALFMMNTGVTRMGFPCVGSWSTYGLGSENENLPGFVVMLDPRGGPISGAKYWSSGYMPAQYEGTILRSAGAPLLDLARPQGMSAATQRELLDMLRQYNTEHQALGGNHPAATRSSTLIPAMNHGWVPT